jgi:hypothetical protein
VSVEEYLRRVDLALRDLPWRMRRDLVSELRAHLAELPADADLGSPEQYAADLRSAAELEQRRGPVAFLRARRPRSVLLTAVALTVVGLAIGAVVWVQTYQPLEPAFGSIEPYDAVGAPAGDSESAVFHDGRPFRFGITVQNTGPFTVRIVDVPEVVPFTARLMMSGSLKNYAVRGPYTRFHPFDLQPGQVRLVFFEGARAKCGWRGVTDVETGIAIRFGFLWRTATTVVRVPQKLAIIVPKDARCVTP